MRACTANVLKYFKRVSLSRKTDAPLERVSYLRERNPRRHPTRARSFIAGTRESRRKYSGCEMPSWKMGIPQGSFRVVSPKLVPFRGAVLTDSAEIDQ